MFAASAVAIGAYRKNLAERGITLDLLTPDPEALEFAQLMVRRTQSSSFFKDAPPIISQGKLTGNVSIDKLIMQFQSFMLTRWSVIEHDMIRAGLAGGRTKQAANIFLWLAMAGVSESFIRHWSKEMIAAMTGAEPPEDDELSEIAIKQAISNVPFVSSMVNSAQYGSVPVPAVSMVSDIFESLSYAEKSKSAAKKAKHYTNAAIMSAGAILGVPGAAQAKDIASKVIGTGKAKSASSGIANP